MSDQNTSLFKVEDMTCGHCVKTITNAIMEKYPSAKVDIDLDKHLVKVGNVTDKADLTAIIKEEGYTPQSL
ncbi:heavy-metal-associated domain-containing protein [uncultured Bartonella sp.]|uniref:heavy-metal-associated domain-containing protein n=1 Tax=uncultured Bartonella sp. TaxID=104108 RepID=UPI0026310B97|nr:heavy-metal-associated domain-containing protein [uncultured Bartonella sp.]